MLACCKKIASSCVLICLVTTPCIVDAGPAQDFGLFNTGVNDQEIPLLDNEFDPHYELVEPSHVLGEPIVATSTGGFPIPPWVPDNNNSAWITPSEDTNGLGDFDGEVSYVYRTTFDIGMADPNTLEINGLWSTDNAGMDIVLNGNSLGFTNTAQFGGFSPFILDSGFVQGSNVLEFSLNNGANEDNPDGPTGLRVEFEGNGPPPPPPPPPPVRSPFAIPGMYNTGVDDNGQALEGDAVLDPHYTIVEGADGDPLEALTVPNDGFPIPPWAANTSESRWISPPDALELTDANNLPGTYLYETTFDLTGLDPNNFAIVMSRFTDDGGPVVLLNDVEITAVASRGFTPPDGRTWIAINAEAAADAGAEILPGENRLTFQVDNGLDVENPTGLKIDSMFARAAPAGSDAIPGLFNTGVGDDRLPLGDDEDDEHYALTVTPEGDGGASTAIAAPPVPPWVDPTGSSRWVGAGDDPGGNGLPGDYEYEIEFDLTGLDASRAIVMGLWSANDIGGEILLNGQPTGIMQEGGFRSLSEFEVSADEFEFLPEKNTLTFRVTNGGESDNPTGLRVEGLMGFIMSGPNGDFNGNGMIDADDIDLLSVAVLEMTNESRFDVDGSGTVDADDRTFWIEEIAETWLGDANLDGEFNSSDFVQVFQVGQYEDTIIDNSTWAEGDWNGDREFNSSDFVAAFQDGGFEVGPRQPVAVPEPVSLHLMVVGLVLLIEACRRTRSVMRLHPLATMS